MSKPSLQIPEPTLPEHLLIRDAAPVPELSAGLKSRVMADCSVSIAQARKIWRMKVAGTVAAVCCLSLLIAVAIPSAPDTPTDSVNRRSQTQPVRPISPGGSPGYDSSSSIAIDNPRPLRRTSDPDSNNDLMETLSNRKLMDANMLF